MRLLPLATLRRYATAPGLAVLMACSADADDVMPLAENMAAAESPSGVENPGSSAVMIPLIDMGQQSYHGEPGGLYRTRNDMWGPHRTSGLNAARRIVPRDVNGNPSANGRIVLMSIGMSNVAQEWCSYYGTLPCNSWTFTGQAAADPAVNRTTLRIVNGAARGATARNWTSPNLPDYGRIRNQVLAPQGLSERQVQVIWLKTVNPDPTTSMPSPNADAIDLIRKNGQVLRALRQRYPNLQQVFLSSRIYGGYANSTTNPEPYAYESAFAVRATIVAQLRQSLWGQKDPLAGDLAYPGVVPWIAWGPYLWADGTRPRSDGLVWLRSDFRGDGLHPSTSGERKVGQQLLKFFKTQPETSCWFLAGRTC